MSQATYSWAELAALKSAYAKGLQEVEFDGVRKKYDSGAAMLERIRTIEAELTQQSSAVKRLRVTHIRFPRRS